jgi:hypothetical protein
MRDEELIAQAKEALKKHAELPASERIQRLIDKGVIDEHGRVLMWDAFLAVIAVKRNGGKPRIENFRCLKPVFGMPGLAEIDVCRENMVDYVGKEKQRVITAKLNEEQRRWKEGQQIHLTPHGYLRVDDQDVEEDNLGELEEFYTVRNGL